MNKTELAHKIQSIEGLTAEERTALLGLLRSHKKYGLVWEDKPEAVEQKLETELPVLKEVPSRAIISDNPEAPNHILIEGDNLEALTTLAYTHEGKIDVIYIDPPYNTGNKDFWYNDSYVRPDDDYKHSMWLSFMSKRLRIAKKLLSDTGVIFLSIDDHEQANLKLLCDEIFGEPNYVGLLPRVTKKSGKDHSDDIAKNHDYVLIYSKEPQPIFMGVQSDAVGFTNQDEHFRQRGPYKVNQTLDYDSLWYNPAMDFPIIVDGVYYYPGGSKALHDARHAGQHNPKDWVWRWSQAKFDFGLKHGFVIFKKSRNGVRIYTKTYLNASIEKDKQGNYYVAHKERETKMSSLALVENEFSNDNAKKELGRLMDANAFDFPKPSSLIYRLISLIPNKDCTILDFFAGSGTTLHAVMQLNKDDGGNRDCIICTNNENGICENVTYERCRRVILGYDKSEDEFIDGLTDNNLRYYRTAFVGRRRTPQNMRRLMLLATDMLCIKENVYIERDEFAGMPTLENGFRFFDDGKKQMLIIYNEEAIYDLVEVLENMATPEQPIITYVFSPANDPWRSEFETVSDKVSLTALPAAIYNAYKRVLPKPKDVIIAEEEKSEEPETAKESLFDFDEVIDEVTLFTNKERGEA